jgi:hypothetical protein
MNELLIRIVENQQSIGLLYDGAGIFILGIISWRTRIDEIIQISKTEKYENVQHLRHLIKTRLDTLVGAIILFIGFVIQFLTIIGVLMSAIINILLLIILFISSFYYLVYGRKSLSKHYLGKIIVLEEIK